MARIMEPEKTATMRQETAFDVVCGKGLKPDEAVAARTYRGETFYFCCIGCAEAFEANPAAYLREAPIRAYRVEEKRAVGPDPERLRALEAEAGRYGPEIAEAERRAGNARENMARLQRELEQARGRLAESRARLQAMETRAEAAPVEGARIAELEQQVERERMESEAAERALAEAQRRQREFLLRERGEVDQLAQREQALQEEIRTLQMRLREAEAKPSPKATQREVDEARSRLAQLQAQMEELGRRKGVVRGKASAEAGRISGVEAPAPVRGVEREQATAMGELGKLEDAERALQADIAAQAALLAKLEERAGTMASSERELADANQRLDMRRSELESVGKRSDEIRSELAAEDRQLADLQRQLERERQEFEAARRALTDARKRAEQIARQRRAEIARLQRGEAGTRAGMEAAERRAESIEAQIKQLEDEARAADARAAELREAERRAQGELERMRREKREVALEGIPSIAGEEPGEFYRAVRVQKGHGGRQGGPSGYSS